MRKAPVEILSKTPARGLALGLACALTLGVAAAEEAKPSAPPPKPPKPRFVPNPELPRLSDGQLRVIPPPPIPAAGEAPMAPAPSGKGAEVAPPPSPAPAPAPTTAPVKEPAKQEPQSVTEAAKPAPAPKPAAPKAKPKAKPAATTVAKGKAGPVTAEAPPKKGFFADWFAPKPAEEAGTTAPTKSASPRKAEAKTPPPATQAANAPPVTKKAEKQAPAATTKPAAAYLAVVTASEGAFLYRFPESGMISQRLSPGEVVEVLETGEARHRIRTARGAQGYLKVEALRKASRTEARRFGSGRE